MFQPACADGWKDFIGCFFDGACRTAKIVYGNVRLVPCLGKPPSNSDHPTVSSRTQRSKRIRLSG